MARVSLLERIRAGGEEGGDRELIRSVLRNLQRVLNTRRGSAETVPDLGIPDFTEIVHTMPESVLQFGQAIRRTVRLFEPRLEHVRVRYVPYEEDPLSIHFEILGQVRSERGGVPVTIHTEVSAEGEVRVKE